MTEAGVPLVVGFDDVVGDHDALKATQIFLYHLFHGKTVGEALQEANTVPTKRPEGSKTPQLDVGGTLVDSEGRRS